MVTVVVTLEIMYKLHQCEWCREEFISKRSHSRFCGGTCRVRAYRMREDFILIDELVPEEDVATKYCNQQDYFCLYYFHWFHQKDRVGGVTRFADVHLAKEFSSALIDKMRRKKSALPIRIVS